MGSDPKKKKRTADEMAMGEGMVGAKRESEEASHKKRKKHKLAAEKTAGSGHTLSVNDVPALVSPIASPKAGKKLTKKVYKLIPRAAKIRALRRGIKEVVLALRKGEKGFCVMAGDVFPVEVLAHLPLLCEEADIPYCFVARKAELGAAGLTKRPTSVVLVHEEKLSDELKGDYKECFKEVKALANLY